MTSSYVEQLKTFTIDSLPDLDSAVLGALELFSATGIPRLDVRHYKRPLVAGSGNAEATGRIIFRDTDAVFASESTVAGILQRGDEIDGVVVISASGSKHAPIIAGQAQKHGKHVTLVTNTEDAPASEYADETFVYPKNREPYTYNTSTYLGMILGHTQEDPSAIQSFIAERIDALDFPDFGAYDKYFFIVPPRFSEIIRMLQVKFIELFGRRIARDVETLEYMKHAVTVVPSDELFMSFGEKNTLWGDPDHRFHVPLPDGGDYGALVAVAYYLIGKIQKAHPPYFKENIVAYTEAASRAFGSTITPIVE